MEVQLLEQLAALAVCEPQGEAAVEIEHAEDHVGGRGLAGDAADGALGAQVHALLQALEAGRPVLVEGDDLPVEHGFAGPQLSSELAQLGVAELTSLRLRLSIRIRPGRQ